MTSRRRYSSQCYHPIIFYLLNHLRSFLFALGEMMRAPASTLMTVAVIGISMALPSGFYFILKNVQSLSHHWHAQPSISIYLKKQVSDSEISAYKKQLKDNVRIASIEYISPEKGLKEFSRLTHLGKLFDHVNENPLPSVIVVVPTKRAQTPAAMKKLNTELGHDALVSFSQLDLSWVERLYNLLLLFKRIIIVLGLLFSIGVIIITSNTIRLTTQSHQKEINLMRLIGARPSFIRRPMLYRGALYGFFGGLLAWGLVTLMLFWLSNPARSIASSYGAEFVLHGFGIVTGLCIVAISTLLSWLGALSAVTKQLNLEETL